VLVNIILDLGFRVNIGFFEDCNQVTDMTDDHEEFKLFIKDMVIRSVCEEFVVSAYPLNPVVYLFEGVEVKIDMPPIYPEYVMSIYEYAYDAFRACPSIEKITIPDPVKVDGYFDDLVESLGKLEIVDCVCVSANSNQYNEKKLSAKSDWKILDNASLERPFCGFYKDFS